jgi:hypothetical protein
MEQDSAYLGSRDVEAFFRRFLGISEEGAKAFTGRMKHLIRQKFPEGVNTGHGVPARYYADQFFQVVVVVELWQWGVPPARATRLVTEAWPALRSSVRTIWRSIEAAEQGRIIEVQPIFWRVPVEALAYLTAEDRPWRQPDADKLVVLTPSEREQLEQLTGGREWRVAYIEADKLLRQIFEFLKFGSAPMPFAKIASLMSTLPPETDDDRST